MVRRHPPPGKMKCAFENYIFSAALSCRKFDLDHMRTQTEPDNMRWSDGTACVFRTAGGSGKP